jgi:hypothetical protein
MATERQVKETIARCVSIMVCYHNGEKTRLAHDMMVAEVQTVAGWVMEMDLGPCEKDERILHPVERELLMRFGPEVGPRLNVVFIKAFGHLDAMGHPVFGNTESAR